MVIRGPFPDVEIPDQPLTEFVLARAGEFRDTAALTSILGKKILLRF